MIFKLRTSKKTMMIFSEIGGSENLQPYILSKLAISASIKSKERLQAPDLNTDSNGLELNRQTITGEYDTLFKILIEQYEGRSIDDDEYMRIYLKSHIDRGAKIIYSEFRYGGNFLENLLKDEAGL